MTRRFLLAALAVLPLVGAVTSCNRSGKVAPADHAMLESPMGEAVVRFMLTEADDVRQRAKLAVLVIGEGMEESSAAFRARFGDAGLNLVDGSTLTKVWVGPEARIVEKKSGLQPLQLQLTSATRRTDGGWEVIAAWAYGDRFVRKRYVASQPAGESGPWKIEPLELIAEKSRPGGN